VNTICRPSGEIAGLLTLSISMKVSLVSVPLSAPFLGWAITARLSESKRNNTSELERRSVGLIGVPPTRLEEANATFVDKTGRQCERSL
jgi:hypothetical protein